MGTISQKVKENYVTPLGGQRGDPEGPVHPAWQLIHEERIKRGWSMTYLGELLDRSVASVISKGERGGHVGLNMTEEILRIFGHKLIVVPLEESDAQE